MTGRQFTIPLKRGSAANSTQKGKRPSITMAQRGVYHVIKHAGPMTDLDLVFLYEPARRLLDRGSRYPAQTQSGLRSRRCELVAKGYVELHDFVRVNGRRVRLWKAV